jgi:hypothetical protein
LPDALISRHHRPTPGHEFLFFLKRGNPKGDVQGTETCEAGDQWQQAEASNHQTEYRPLQPTEPEESSWQEHQGEQHAQSAVNYAFIPFEHFVSPFSETSCLFAMMDEAAAERDTPEKINARE